LTGETIRLVNAIEAAQTDAPLVRGCRRLIETRKRRAACTGLGTTVADLAG